MASWGWAEGSPDVVGLGGLGSSRAAELASEAMPHRPPRCARLSSCLPALLPRPLPLSASAYRGVSALLNHLFRRSWGAPHQR